MFSLYFFIYVILLNTSISFTFILKIHKLFLNLPTAQVLVGYVVEVVPNKILPLRETWPLPWRKFTRGASRR